MNICQYRPDPNILTQAKVNREFALIHKYLCFLASEGISGNGTVTNVGLSLPSFITVSNSPVTTTGVLTGTLAAQTANTFFAGPSSGASTAPTFRTLVASDIPVPIVNNGLQLISGAVGLGGTLTQNTAIDMTGFSLTLTGVDTNPSQILVINPNFDNFINYTGGEAGSPRTIAINTNVNGVGASSRLLLNAVGNTSFIDASATSNQFVGAGLHICNIGVGGIALTTAGGGPITFNNSLVAPLTTAEFARFTNSGNLGLRTSTPTAKLHIAAGSATTGTAPIKLTSGTVLTTPEAGAIEYNGTHFFGTVGSTRIQLDNNSISNSFTQAVTAINTVTVTIGSTLVSNTYRVNVTASNLLSSVPFFVNNKTTTTFDVVFTGTPLTGTIAFDWVLVQ